MAPTKIMLIRHGEKQSDFPDDPNIDRNGQPDRTSLNHQGWRRAQKLVGFFEDAYAPGIGTPSTIFAAAPNSDSQRPLETVTPFAEALWPDPTVRAERFQTAFAVDDYDKMIEAAKGTDGVCLICWEHHVIPGIAAKIPHTPPSPGKWSGSRFDVVWVFDPHPAAWAFQQVPQNLLPGDQNRPI